MADDYDIFNAELYDLAPHHQGRADAAFLVGMAVSPILELGCGTGRTLLPLADAGHEVVGVDRSPVMLSRLRARLDAAADDVRARVTLKEADIASLSLGRAFPLVIIPAGVFHHLTTTPRQIACLESSVEHLAHGGTLVIDVMDPKSFQPTSSDEPAGPAATEGRLADGRSARVSGCLLGRDPSTQLVLRELTYVVSEPGGYTLRLVERSPLRYFHRREIEGMLGRCGLRVRELYGDYERSPYGARSPQMIFVAERAL